MGTPSPPLGDLDGDSVPDLAVGATKDINGGGKRGAVHIHFMNANGSVKSTVEINSDTTNGPAPVLYAQYGFASSSIGDLDGDSVPDLAVGVYKGGPVGAYRGVIYIHFLNTDGSVKSTVEINGSTANGPADLIDYDWYGWSIAAPGDLDGDSVPDLAVGAFGDDAGGTNHGAVHIHFMNASGSVKSTVEINDNTANGPVLSDYASYGFSSASLGDLNLDGIPELVICDQHYACHIEFLLSGNNPPVAVGDAGSYSVAEGGFLSVPAGSGVLVNDTDADIGDTLIADLVSDDTLGALDLSSDGSFTYTPPADWGGTDTFTYRAYDGEAYSSAATVEIDVITSDYTTAKAATMERMKAGGSGAFALSFTLSNTISGPLTVTFPTAGAPATGFTVTGAFTSGSCSGGGTIDTFGFTSGTLTAEKHSCTGTVTLFGAEVTNPTTAGLYTVSWVNDDPGEIQIPITDDDAVSVYGNVDPTLTFDIDIGKLTGDDNAQPYAIDFGQVDFGTPEASDNSALDSIWLDFETNATGGGTVFVRSANAAMVSASTLDQWSSVGGSLAANTEEYGICVDSTIVGTPRSGHPGGTSWAAQGDYATGASCDGGSTMDVGLLSTSDTALMTAAGPIDAGRVQVRVGMSVAAGTPAHPDYGDVLTFIAAATY